MKLILLTAFLLVVKLCSSQSSPEDRWRRPEGCPRDFYYQGRDHYYPDRDREQHSRYYPRWEEPRRPTFDYPKSGYPCRGQEWNSWPYNSYPYQGQEWRSWPYTYPRQYEERRRYYTPGEFEYLSSCQDILYKYPETPSGYYYITAGPEKIRKVYCEMEKEFCGSKGWEKFYFLDFLKNTSHLCPGNFRKSYYPLNTSRSRIVEKPERKYYCEATVDAGCTTAKLNLDDTQYTEICAKIGGYQYGHPTAFKPYHKRHNKVFMDGVYFSYGKEPKYLWGYAVGSYKQRHKRLTNIIGYDINNMCPDVHPDYNVRIPVFVKNYFYCDSGAYDNDKNDTSKFFYENRLFEGENCELPNYSCMQGGPWFHRKLPTYFKDYIELSSCNDARVAEKDLRMDNIEIYLR